MIHLTKSAEDLSSCSAEEAGPRDVENSVVTRHGRLLDHSLAAALCAAFRRTSACMHSPPSPPQVLLTTALIDWSHLTNILFGGERLIFVDLLRRQRWNSGRAGLLVTSQGNPHSCMPMVLLMGCQSSLKQSSKHNLLALKPCRRFKMEC